MGHLGALEVAIGGDRRILMATKDIILLVILYSVCEEKSVSFHSETYSNL